MSSSVHWPALDDPTLTGINPFFLFQASLVSRSSPDESEQTEPSRWPEPHFSPDLGMIGTWSWVPGLTMPLSISISEALMMEPLPSHGSFSLSPSSLASSPMSRSLSSGHVSGSSTSNGGAPRELLGSSLQSHARMKCPPSGRGVDENAGEQLELPHPRPEGEGVPESNLCIPGPKGSSSSSSSSEEVGLKVAENDITGTGA